MPNSKLLVRKASSSVQSFQNQVSDIRNAKRGSIELELDNNDKVFGRENEQKQLARILEQCQNGNGPQVVAVHGPQGSGKTSLIQSMKETWASKEETNALFVSATFGHQQEGNSSSRSALVDTLEELCRAWALTPNGETEIQEYLKLIQGQQEAICRPIPSLYNKQNKANPWCCEIDSPEGKTCLYRKKLAIKLLLDSICRQPSRSVILFLDDFQFADEPSLDILNFILQGSGNKATQGLVLVAVYREESPEPLRLQNKDLSPSKTDEINSDFTIYHAVQAIETWKTTKKECMHDIHVQDLCIFGVCEMIFGLLNRSDSATTSLAEVIFHKTHGNPFCICQFLRLLQDEGFLFYSLSTYQWEWTDVEHIQTATSIANDNVADIITASIYKFPQETQQVLMVASCLGKQIPLEVLHRFFSHEEDSEEFSVEDDTSSLSSHEVTSTKLEDILDSAVKMEILTKHSGATSYNWSHDRVREAVEKMVSKRDRVVWHLRLGKVAYKLRSSKPNEEWLVYLIRDQFSKLTPMVSNEKMRISLAKLNQEAAQLCISRSALYQAGQMLREGINLLDPETRWTEQYDLCIDMFTNLAEIAYALGNHEECKIAVDSILRHAKTPQDTSRANFALIQSIAAGPDRGYDGAIEKTVELLANEGVRIRPNSKKPQFLLGLDQVSGLPIMEDEKAMMISKLLSLLAMFAVEAERMSFAESAVSHCIRLALDSGISTYLPTAIVVQGLILMHQGKIQKAQSQGELALAVLDRFEGNQGEFHIRTVQMIYFGIFNAVKPFHESLDVFMGVHQMGLATKALEHGILGGKHYSLCYLAVGLPLGALERDLATFTEESIQSNLGPAVEVYFRIFRQTILNLQGKAASPTVLVGEALDCNAFLSGMHGNSLLIAHRDVSTFQLMLACIFNDLDMAEKMLNILEPFPLADLVVARGHIRMMFMGLAGFALSRKRGRNGFRYLHIARRVLKHFEHDVKYGSVNAHPVLEFLRAEESPSREAYDKAIRTSARSGLMHLQAMLNERAGLFFLDHSEEDDATFYLSKAEQLYQDWGATGKVSQLRHDYRCLFSVPCESRQQPVSCALKGRSRVKTIRQFAAIHDLDKSPSPLDIELEEGMGSIDFPRKNIRNSSLELGNLDISLVNLRTSIKDSSNDAIDVSSYFTSEPDEEMHPNRISHKMGIFTSGNHLSEPRSEGRPWRRGIQQKNISHLTPFGAFGVVANTCPQVFSKEEDFSSLKRSMGQSSPALLSGPRSKLGFRSSGQLSTNSSNHSECGGSQNATWGSTSKSDKRSPKSSSSKGNRLASILGMSPASGPKRKFGSAGRSTNSLFHLR